MAAKEKSQRRKTKIRHIDFDEHDFWITSIARQHNLILSRQIATFSGFKLCGIYLYKVGTVPQDKLKFLWAIALFLFLPFSNQLKSYLFVVESCLNYRRP